MSPDQIHFATRAKTILFLNWKPALKWTDADGDNATVNSTIDAMARSIGTLGATRIFLTVHHEPENDVSGTPSDCATSFTGTAGTATEYTAMWRNVRQRFDAAGVTNVVWAVNYMSYAPYRCMVDDLYPGNDLVDWVVFDNYGTAGRDDFVANVREMYDLFTKTSDEQHDYLSKPWGIAEWNIRKGNLAWQQTYDYYDDARAAVENGVFPQIKAYMIYDSIGPDGNENRVGYQAGGVLDPIKQQHYTAFAQSSAFQDSPSPPGDTTAPTVTLTAPSDGSTHQGDVTVTADVEDDTAVSQVSLVVDGALVASASTPTGSVAEFVWDSTTVDDGEHQIQVQASDSGGNSTVSAPVNIRVGNDSPGEGDTEAPTRPVAQLTSATADGVTLSWTQSEDNVGVASYEVTRDGVLLAATSELTYTDAQVRQGASYTYTVVAVDRAGNRSPSSAAVNATVADTTAPSTPATPTGRLSTNSSIALTWPAATDNVGISGYEVWRDGSLLGKTTQSSFTDTTCVQGKAYSYRVAAIDTSNNRSALSPATAPIAVPDVTAPTAPTQLAGTTPTRRTVVLRWRAATDNVGVASYLIYRDSSRIATVSGTTMAYTVSSLRSGSTYRFSVRAVDGAGNLGPMSTVISVRAT